VPLAEIVSYSPGWPAAFREIGGALRVALGPLALRIDHIGSTSVPGLAAKDVIDVQVTVAALDQATLSAGFERAGFVPAADNPRHDHQPPGAIGPDDDWAKLFFRPAAGVFGGRRINVHVRAAGRANQRYALLFRDYLRAHPAAAAAYAELKRRLAALGLETGVYAEVKDPACDLIMQAAEPWAARIRWQPGSIDA
jgi:GrpB-like predicted nucleotidyltransferase (UPF0157 family)